MRILQERHSQALAPRIRPSLHASPDRADISLAGGGIDSTFGRAHALFSLGAVAEKFRSNRSGALRARRSARANPRQVRLGRATKPWRAIDRATGLTDTFQPASRSSSQTRGYS